MWKKFCSSVGSMFNFSGREKRNVFWSTVLFALIIMAIPMLVIGITVWMQSIFHKTFQIAGTDLIVYERAAVTLFALLLYFPVVSCGVRRLHDVNVSGLLLLIPVVNIVLLCLPSSLKSVEEKSGARHGVGQFLVLLVFIVLAGFSAVTFIKNKNGEPQKTVSEKTDDKKNVDAEKKNASQSEPEKIVEKNETVVVAEPEPVVVAKQTSSGGNVVIPITDERKFNYVRMGEENLQDGGLATQYKHVQTLSIDFLENTSIYDSFDSDTVIGTVTLGEQYTVLSLIQITNPQRNDNIGQFWLEIVYGKGSGFVSAGRIDNPYRNENYVPLEQLQTGNTIWTVRKFDSLFSFYHSIDIRDFPGVEGTSVIGKIDASLNNMKTVVSDAITEQDDTSASPIGGEPWIRIEYEGITGWIPGAYADIEHGGVKYQTPDGILANDLGLGI